MRRLFSTRSLLGFIGVLVLSGVAYAQVDVGVAVSFGPPELPVYEQPICPAEGYIWTPGYWAWDGDDYYWVPGRGWQRPGRDFFGPRAIGLGEGGDTTFTKAIGARWLVSMAVLITDLAILATGMKAGAGTTIIFITTAR